MKLPLGTNSKAVDFSSRICDDTGNVAGNVTGIIAPFSEAGSAKEETEGDHP
jgi:hypothetical protein